MGDVIRVQWNQLCPAISKDAWQVYSSTFTSAIFDEGICTQTYLKSARGYNVSLRPIDATLFPCVIGEILYCSYEIYPESDSTWSAELGGSLGESIPVTAIANNWTRVAVRITASKTGNYRPLVADRRSASGAVNAVIKIRNAMSVNLTQMFGTGNEPNLEEFEAQCALNGIDLAQYQAQDSGTERDWIIPHYNQQMMERKKQILINSPHIKSINNSLASFKTDMIAPLKSAKVYFEPKQDLHGYDHPWVGGSGKNLLNVSADNMIGNVSLEDKVELTETGFNFIQSAICGFWVNVKPSTTYTYSYTSTYNGSSMHARVYELSEKTDNWSYDKLTVNKTSWPGSETFTTGENTNWLIVGAYAYGDGLNSSLTNMQVEEGSTATSYEPYENICPIEGWNAIDLYKSGKNLLRLPVMTRTVNGITWIVNEDGSIQVDGTASRNTWMSNWHDDSQHVDFYLKAGTYVLSRNGTPPVASIYLVARDGSTTKDIGQVARSMDSTTFTLEQDTLVGFQAAVTSSQGEIHTTIRPQLELLNLTDYEAPNNSLIPITFSSEAGTVYGGYIDLIKGKLVQTHKSITLNGSEGWFNYKTSQQMHFVLSIPDKKPGLGTSISSIFPNVKNIFFWDNELYSQYGDHERLKNIYVNAPYKMPDLVPEWKAWLAEHPMQLVYELATPIEYDIDPQTLETLRGINNIWSDAGPVEVQYWTH